jgi:signal transduction histidine kinase
MKLSLVAPIRVFLNIPSLDAEDARRRRLLNILLAGIGILSAAGIVIILVLDFFGIQISVDPVYNEAQLFLLLYATAGTLLAGTIILYLINRYLSGWLASSLFLIFLTLVFLFSDTPIELIKGRSLFFFALPIFMASVLIRSLASFMAAGIIIIIHTYIALSIDQTPNLMAHLGFITVATISWLSARSLEQALRDLKETNRDLDLRVTERTQQLSDALERERSEASKNQAILEGITDGVVLFDNIGTAVVANPAFIRMLNIPHDQIIGLDIVALAEQITTKQQDRKNLLEMLHDPSNDRENIHFDWNNKSFSMNASPVLGLEGQRIGTAAVFRDFTREAEVARMKDAFLAMVSHELRTPLNAILGYTEMLQEGIYGQISAHQREATHRVWTNSRRLLDLVSDLLDQAQIESGKISFQNQYFEPAELLGLMHSIMDQLAAEKRLMLTSIVEDSMPEKVFGDIRRLQQILVNLVNNAVKYTDKGSIWVRMYKNAETYWCLEVTDTGRGISPEFFPRIFEPFQQGKNSGRDHKGIGLGLTIVRRLVDIMGGQVEVHSTYGTGSTFRVLVPDAPYQHRDEKE